MKKKYEKPFAELIEFSYTDQIVVASGGKQNTNVGATGCTSPHPTNENLSSCNWQ